MSDASPGPEVDPTENLFRCITTNDWWVAEEGRPSSAAFKQPDFSTDMESIAKTPEYTLRRFPAGCGLVAFNYGTAKAIGFVARQEGDPSSRTTSPTPTSTTASRRGTAARRWHRSSWMPSSRPAAFAFRQPSPDPGRTYGRR